MATHPAPHTLPVLLLGTHRVCLKVPVIKTLIQSYKTKSSDFLLQNPRHAAICLPIVLIILLMNLFPLTIPPELTT